MQALLGLASRGGSRRAILHEFGRLLDHSGPYAGSTEELTPLAHDGAGAVPLAMTLALLLASPSSAAKLARGGFGEHLLDVRSIAEIDKI
jgi:hypothetical protein